MYSSNTFVLPPLQSGHRAVPSPTKFSYATPCIQTFAPPQPLAHTNLFSVPVDLPFLECHIHSVIEDVTSGD